MRFVYVFALMFLAIFGLASLISALYRALVDGAARKFDVYVQKNEYLPELSESLKNNPNIGRVFVLSDNSDSSDSLENAVDLSEICRDKAFFDLSNKKDRD